jgi:uncharacterized protein YeaO (DUF488 family)
MQMTFQIKRIYESALSSDGTRVLVDRLWPRGVKKADALLDYWMKDVAPTTELRRWFGHLRARFDEFRRLYETELRDNPSVGELRKLGGDSAVTLLYAAHDPEVNHALILKSVLQRESTAERITSVSAKKKSVRR